ncbi:MAG: hypothetical protein ACRC9R_06910, partial [Enterovibrio sp.]
GFLLNVSPSRVKSWRTTLPTAATALAREARREGIFSSAGLAAPLSIPMPVDVLDWPEIVRFLLSHFSMQLAPAAAAASPSLEASASALSVPGLIMRLSFTDTFISRQETELSEMLREFNTSRDEKERRKILARVVCVFKDNLPFGIFTRVCELLGVLNSNASTWCNLYRRRVAEAQAPATARPSASLTVPPALASTSPAVLQALITPQAASALMPQSTASSSTLNVTPAVVTRQTPQILPAQTTQPATLPVATHAAATTAPLQTPLQTLTPRQTAPIARPAAATSAGLTMPARQPPPAAATAFAQPRMQFAAAQPVFATPTTSAPVAQLAPIVPPFTQSAPGTTQDAQPSTSSDFDFGDISDETWRDFFNMSNNDLRDLLTSGGEEGIAYGLEDELMVEERVDEDMGEAQHPTDEDEEQ